MKNICLEVYCNLYDFKGDVLARVSFFIDIIIKSCMLNNDFRNILPWLITTSCLISEFQISGRTSETLSREFKSSAEDLYIRLRV